MMMMIQMSNLLEMKGIVDETIIETIEHSYCFVLYSSLEAKARKLRAELDEW
jgi:hypothetical protein